MLWITRWRSFLRSEGRVFDSRWCRRNFSLTQFCRPQYVRGVGSVSDRNEYQEYFVGSRSGRCVGLTTSPHLCGECLEVWEPQTFWNRHGLSRVYFTFFTYHIRYSPTKINAHNSEFPSKIQHSTL